MRDFHGNLLIGGATLKSLHGELEDEQPPSGSHEWLLDGQLHLRPDDWETMRTNRLYRLELDDGRAGQVVISRVVSQTPDEVVVDFQHAAARERTHPVS